MNVHALFGSTMTYVHRKLHHREPVFLQVLTKKGSCFHFLFRGDRQVEKYEQPHDVISVKSKFGQGERAARSFMGQGSDGTGQDSPYADEPTYNWRGRFKAARSGWREQGLQNSNNANLEVLNDLEERFGPNTTIGQAKSRIKMSNGAAKGRITQSARRIYNAPTGF